MKKIEFFSLIFKGICPPLSANNIRSICGLELKKKNIEAQPKMGVFLKKSVHQVAFINMEYLTPLTVMLLKLQIQIFARRMVLSNRRI